MPDAATVKLIVLRSCMDMRGVRHRFIAHDRFGNGMLCLSPEWPVVGAIFANHQGHVGSCIRVAVAGDVEIEVGGPVEIDDPVTCDHWARAVLARDANMVAGRALDAATVPGAVVRLRLDLPSRPLSTR